MPQYAFRLFSQGRQYIHLMRLKHGDICFRASIRGQCARHKFYGDRDAEDILSELESKHAQAIRHLINFINGGPCLSIEDDYNIREAILLQRHRTPPSIANFVSGVQGFNNFVLKGFVNRLPDRRLRAYAQQSVADDSVRVEASELGAKLFALNEAVCHVPLVCDLRMIVIRNRTDYPFILSDSPAVALNLFGWRFKNRGVLGLNSPGLMITLPLTPSVQVAIFDSNTYQFETTSDGQAELTSMADVSQLNALQLHAAENCIYFSDIDAAGYIADLYLAHSRSLSSQPAACVVHPKGTMLIDGVLNKDELLHHRQAQIPHKLQLSILKAHEAASEAAVTLGRHAKDSTVYRGCATRKGPFPNIPLSTGLQFRRRKKNHST